jgi:hypothetical protein
MCAHGVISMHALLQPKPEKPLGTAIPQKVEGNIIAMEIDDVGNAQPATGRCRVRQVVNAQRPPGRFSGGRTSPNRKLAC